MKSIIVGTAGHIDHGKTALVKALTGIDADRLAEEKRRGITIDLGFAHMELSGVDGKSLRLGFVDVPGHERFVRNMLAGVAGMDLVLLVIAADESIKPQTREHFDILQLLGVQRGITVITKSDAVDAETLEVVRLEIEEFLRGTFLDANRSPVIAVSSLTGAGLEDLKRAIAVVAADAQARDARALPRLPIDRVFTIKGFGTVVTGTLMVGTIRCEDELEMFPSGQRVRVRGVQVHGQKSDAAIAGQRTALNLTGVSTDDLSRGMTLASVATFATTRRADVRVKLLPSVPRALKDRSRAHFHCNTMEGTVEIALHKSKQLLAGNEAFARLKLPENVLLLPGDRFTIRQFSPVVTIGGGEVLDATPMPRMPGLEAFLQILSNGNPAAILKARIARRGCQGISLSNLVAETGWTQDFIKNHISGMEKAGMVLRAGERFVDAPTMLALQQDVLAVLGKFYEQNSLAAGMAREELRQKMKCSTEVFVAGLDLLAKAKKIEFSGESVKLAGRGIELKDEESESKKIIEETFASAALKVPALHEVMAGLKVDRVRAQKIVTLLLREKVLIKVSSELIFHQSALASLRRQIAEYKKKAAKIDVAKFKELTGVSRKYAIPLLEYLDRERVTRRVGDVREIL
jgi:selenocysteine-specific elongation factor